jgi:hypothetical protein
MGLPPIPEADTGSSKFMKMGSDLAWKTILASQVEVEGVGQVSVSKVLQEVWKRGGGDMVCLSLFEVTVDELTTRCLNNASGRR